MNYRTIEEVSLEVVSCRRCKRLVSYRESLPARASYSLEEYWRRPVAGYADYRTPIKNLYLCGSGTHPGGGISGINGRNASREILKDWKRIKRQ